MPEEICIKLTTEARLAGCQNGIFHPGGRDWCSLPTARNRNAQTDQNLQEE
jgi:hypothetical protein